MNILTLPKYPTSTITRVPYVSSERYDGGAFLTYPQRKGKEYNAHGKLVNLRKSYNTAPTNDLGPFIQTWLYFGLLFEFLEGIEQLANDIVLDWIYDKFLARDKDGTYLDSLPIISPVLNLWHWKPQYQEINACKQRCDHHFECLMLTIGTLRMSGLDLEHRIIYSISALAECLTTFICYVSKNLNHGSKHSIPWGNGFLTADVGKEMLAAGWCPSDIESVKLKYFSLQTLHMLSKMDRLNSAHGHTRCNRHQCLLYQINDNYKVAHIPETCHCSKHLFDLDAVIAALQKPNVIPLLKILGDDAEQLEVEVIESSSDTVYVAISHVWADGLGNPKENYLPRCQLARLKKMIDALDDPNLSSGERTSIGTLLWIDTLCCPAQSGEAKNKALEKIPQVYKNAKHVLVLDSWLYSVNSAQLHPSEILLRIFNSSWMRRLWTLQEAALAKSLYFRFSDRAVSVDEIKTDLLSRVASIGNLRYLCMWESDVCMDIIRLNAFFPDQKGIRKPETIEPKNLLLVLDKSLHCRSVTVESDEPLCIATLLSLDLARIVKIKDHMERMREVWIMVSEKLGGIPANVAIHENLVLPFPGFRWAPRTLLYAPQSIFEFDIGYKNQRWGAEQLGRLTSKGLRVRFPGFLIRPNPRPKDLKLHPWAGFKLINGFMIYFKGDDNRRYAIHDGYRSRVINNQSEAKCQEYDATHLSPISDAIQRGNCAIVLEEELPAESLDKITHGILVKMNEDTENVHRIISSSSELVVQKVMPIIVSLLREPAIIMQETFQRLAYQLRDDSITKQLAAIEDEESEEHKAMKKVVKQRMIDMIRQEVEEKPEFRRAALKVADLKVWDHDYTDSLWYYITYWFQNDNFGLKLPNDQIWVID